MTPALHRLRQRAGSPTGSGEVTVRGSHQGLYERQARVAALQRGQEVDWLDCCRRRQETQEPRQTEATRPNEYPGSDARVWFAQRGGFPCETAVERPPKFAETKAQEQRQPGKRRFPASSEQRFEGLSLDWPVA